MITLRQILIAVAAAAVSVGASPLSADSTATDFVPKSLQGKELENFLASAPRTPEGLIDLTNTTLGLEVIEYMGSHPNANPLMKRGGACDQKDCPDSNAPFDFFSQRFVNGFWGHPIVVWAYFGRVNDCGKCEKINTSKNGCWDFTSCGRKQTICVDSGKARAHRIWHDKNHKTCYKAARKDLGNCGVGVTNSIIWHPDGEVPCNW